MPISNGSNVEVVTSVQRRRRWILEEKIGWLHHCRLVLKNYPIKGHLHSQLLVAPNLSLQRARRIVAGLVAPLESRYSPTPCQTLLANSNNSPAAIHLSEGKLPGKVARL
jgi:hypothetical protein